MKENRFAGKLQKTFGNCELLRSNKLSNIQLRRNKSGINLSTKKTETKICANYEENSVSI